jgi:hypothetical protein
MQASTENCVPKCRPEINGDELLLNIYGDDTRMTCELHRTLYSAPAPPHACRVPPSSGQIIFVTAVPAAGSPVACTGWIGAAGDGGFIGEDVQAFFSSVSFPLLPPALLPRCVARQVADYLHRV